MQVCFNVSATQSFNLHVDASDSAHAVAKKLQTASGVEVPLPAVQNWLDSLFHAPLQRGVTLDFAQVFGVTPTLLAPRQPEARTVSERSTLLAGVATSLHGQDLGLLSQQSGLLTANGQASSVRDGSRWVADATVPQFAAIRQQSGMEKILDFLKTVFMGRQTQFMSGLSSAQEADVRGAARQVAAAHPDIVFAAATLPEVQLTHYIERGVREAMPGLSDKTYASITQLTLEGLRESVPRLELNRGGRSVTLHLADGREVRSDKILGGGAFGQVFALSLPDGKEVVLKLPRTYTRGADETELADAYETSATELWAHHHVVGLAPSEHIVDFSGVALTPDGIPLLLCELVRGKPGDKVAELLSHALGTPTERADVARYEFRQKLEALVHIHDKRKVLHLDIKPENFMLAADTLSFKMVDFGLAELETNPQLRGAKGSPVYMAPEVWDPSGRTISPAADIWSLGVSLFQALTGSDPIDLSGCKGVAEVQARVMVWGMDPTSRAVAEGDPRFTAQQRDLLNAMLHPDPAQRPSARELLAHPFFATSISGDAFARKILAQLVPNVVR